jgi:hypothetical protein
MDLISITVMLFVFGFCRQPLLNTLLRFFRRGCREFLQARIIPEWIEIRIKP